MFPCANFQGLLASPRVYNTPVYPKPPREIFRGWTTKQEFPKPEVAANMTKFVDDFCKLKPEERVSNWTGDGLHHGHIANVFLNLLREPDEEEEEDLDLPPGFPPGILPPGFLAGGFGIQVGPVSTVGQVLAGMGIPGGASLP